MEKIKNKKRLISVHLAQPQQRYKKKMELLESMGWFCFGDELTVVIF